MSKYACFQSGVPAFTVPQDLTCIKVLEDRAENKGINLKVVSDLPRNSDGLYLSMFQLKLFIVE